MRKQLKGMYINEVEIENIRSISKFNMKFAKPAGWHVIIGDNGSGKSSVLRSIAFGLIGEKQILGIAPNWNDWVSIRNNQSLIKLGIIQDDKIDIGFSSRVSKAKKELFYIEYVIANVNESLQSPILNLNENKMFPGHLSQTMGWFSAGFGPYRRFSGGTNEFKHITENASYKKLTAHLTLFREEAD
ncbi:MAG: AAA family ATPase, partial [Chitinophagaceae bacterium]|nr:AAA family ATPase [Chitinophagaceae bacterium]